MKPARGRARGHTSHRRQNGKADSTSLPCKSALEFARATFKAFQCQLSSFTPAEGSCALNRATPQIRKFGWLVGKPADLLSDFIRFVWIERQPSRPDNFGDGSGPTGQHRRSAAHCLECRQAEAFREGRQN